MAEATNEWGPRVVSLWAKDGGIMFRGPIGTKSYLESATKEKREKGPKSIETTLDMRLHKSMSLVVCKWENSNGTKCVKLVPLAHISSLDTDEA